MIEGVLKTKADNDLDHDGAEGQEAPRPQAVLIDIDGAAED